MSFWFFIFAKTNYYEKEIDTKSPWVYRSGIVLIPCPVVHGQPYRRGFLLDRGIDKDCSRYCSCSWWKAYAIDWSLFVRWGGMTKRHNEINAVMRYSEQLLDIFTPLRLRLLLHIFRWLVSSESDTMNPCREARRMCRGFSWWLGGFDSLAPANTIKEKTWLREALTIGW